MAGTKVAIAGVGYTDFVADSHDSVLKLARDACADAIDDAGLAVADVDGLGSFMVLQDSVPTQAVATVLGLSELHFALDVNLGGQAPCLLISQAAAAISAGDVETVVVYRAMKGRSRARVGEMTFPGSGAQYRYPIGYSSYMMYVAMWAQRFLFDTGQDRSALAAVALAQRAYAEHNPRAFRRRPLDVTAYEQSPWVVEPFRAADCTVEVDGACAVVLTSLERAKDLRHEPVVIAAGGYAAGPRVGLDIGDHLEWDDYSRNYTSWLGPQLYRRAGLGPEEIQFAEIYDCFSSTVLMGLEGLSLCERGSSGSFVQSGGTRLDGRLPVNTNGGLLCEGYLHGMNTVAEAVLQMQGRGGSRQVPARDACIVTSGALMDGSGLILTRDG